MTDKQFFVLLGVGIIGLQWARKAAVEAVETVAQAINPVNPANVFYAGANAVGEILTGADKGSFSLGSWIYDKVHGE